MKIVALLSSLCLLACGRSPATTHASPAPSRVESPIAEADLATVRLTKDAESRLGIVRAKVESAPASDSRLVSGEIIIPPGRTMTVTAPVGGVVRLNTELTRPGSVVERGAIIVRLVPLAPVDRDVRARADREVSAANAQLEATEARLSRLISLQAEGASSQRLIEEGTAARNIARADLQAAQTRSKSMKENPLLSDVVLTVRAPETGVVRSVSVALDQAVAAGAPLLEIAAVDALQVRVPVYAGDLGSLDLQRDARVRGLGMRIETSLAATPVAGPPTADPDRATVDRYFALPAGALFAPGERVLVELPSNQPREALTLPIASLLRDAEGGAWVYVCEGELAFRRSRVDPLRRVGDRFEFTRGPELGACVASTGASDLFGTEFEPGH